MDSSIISGLIGGVVAVILCTYISKNVRIAKVEGELQFGTFLVMFAWCCIGIVVFALWAFFNDKDAWEKPSELYSVIGLFFGFGFSSIYCFGEYFKVRGKFDDHGIDFYTPWTGRKTEKWAELESVEFNSLANWYVLKFTSGKKIRLSGLLSGHGDVLEIIKAKGYDV